MSGGDWASFGGNSGGSSENKQQESGGGDWASFGGFEKSGNQSQQQGGGGQSWPQQQQPPQQPGVTPPPPSGRTRASMRDRPLPSTPPTQPANPPGSQSPNINPAQAMQLQQYRQRLQQMHQQLSAGQNTLKELQKNPQENQQKITQLTQQLQVGVGQYQKLHQVATQLQQQLIQLQQPAAAPGGQPAPQQPTTPTQPPRQPPPSTEPSKDRINSTGSATSETKPSNVEDDAFTAFEDSNKTTPPSSQPPVPPTEPQKQQQQDFFASFESSTPQTQPQAPMQPQSQAPLQPQTQAPTPMAAQNSGMDMFSASSPQPDAVVTPPTTSFVVDQERINQVEAEKKRLSDKLASTEGRASLLEQEKLQILKDHESLVRSKEDLEKQLGEQKVQLEQQQKRFQEVESRHQEEIKQIRQAGHDALALIVEEYKEQMRLVVQQEREKAEQLLNEAVATETKKCQEILQNQHDRLVAAVDEERVKNEQKLNETIDKLNEEHKSQMEQAMKEAEKGYHEKLQDGLKNERDASATAIQKSCEEERSKMNDLLDQLKSSQKEEMETEKDRHAKEISNVIAQEREQSKDLLKEALAAERKRNEEAIDRAVDRTQASVQAKMEDIARSKDALNQRQLTSLDLFLSGAKSQLESLMSATTAITPHTATPLNTSVSTTGSVSVNAGTSSEDQTKGVASSTTQNVAVDDFESAFGASSSVVTTSDDFTTLASFDD